MEEKSVAIKDARTLGVPKMLLLGLQHMFAMFGATILVPILVNNYFEGEGLSIQVTLICAGLGTLFFHLCSKLKVPAFLGSSFAFLGGFATVANLNTGIFADMTMGEKLPYACGGIVVAGLLYLVLALVIKLAGVHRVMHYLPPVVTGPIIICIGLSLAPSAISNASTNWLIALIALGTIIVFNIWGKGMFKIIPILMGVVVSYVVAAVLNAIGLTNPDGSAILDFSNIASASWVGLPPFQLCKFNLTAILVMAPIALATMMEHIGDMSAISATVGENFIVFDAHFFPHHNIQLLMLSFCQCRKVCIRMKKLHFLFLTELLVRICFLFSNQIFQLLTCSQSGYIIQIQVQIIMKNRM